VVPAQVEALAHSGSPTKGIFAVVRMRTPLSVLGLPINRNSLVILLSVNIIGCIGCMSVWLF
jgi:hypothetical protein